MTINHEHFKAWLFSQPKERPVDYSGGLPTSQPGCVLCNFLRENTQLKVRVGSDFLSDPQTLGAIDHLPQWFMKLTYDGGLTEKTTFGEIQDAYTLLFPDPQAVSCGDGNETLPSEKQTESQTTNS